MSTATITTVYKPDPVTHLLAAWRFGRFSRFVCGQFGYELDKSDEPFKCIPVAPLNQEPWSTARVARLQNGVWMIHPERPIEGVGLFLSQRDAEYAESQMKIPKTTMKVGSADLAFIEFIAPLWPTIDQMEDSFWSNQIEGWETQFRASVELMRRFRGAREIYAVPRLRNGHPYDF